MWVAFDCGGEDRHRHYRQRLRPYRRRRRRRHRRHRGIDWPLFRPGCPPPTLATTCLSLRTFRLHRGDRVNVGE